MTTHDTEDAWTAYRYAVVDVEGNGQRPPDLVELAVVPIVNGEIRHAKEWLVRPPRPITAMARRFHQITDMDVSNQPPTGDVAHEMRDMLNGAVLVAHNAHVDLDVIGRELPGYQPEHVIDTLKLARRVLPGLPSYKLGALVDRHQLAAGVPEGMRPHRAGYDALMCACLLRLLANQLPDATLADLLNPSPAKEPDAALF